MSSVAIPAVLAGHEDLPELPAEWEIRTTPSGRVYFANHLLKTTQWQHPITGKQIITNSTGDAFQGLPYERQELEHSNKNGFSHLSTAMHVLKGSNLMGRIIVITGANSGIGFESAKALAYHGAHVVMACRNMKKAQEASRRIQNHCKFNDIEAKIDAMLLDLASFQSIRVFAENFKRRKLPLHVLICNAAILSGSWQETEDHFERTFAINYLGHFLLIHLLKDVMVSSSPARIVIVTSESHRFQDFSYSSKLSLPIVPLPKDRYWSILAYNQSKLCILLLSMELNRRYSSLGITSNAVHPGNLIYSSLCQSSWSFWLLHLLAKPFNKNTSQGAATVVYCAVHPELEGIGGLYFNDCCQCDPSDEAMDQDKAKALWDKSIKMINTDSNVYNQDTFTNILDV